MKVAIISMISHLALSKTMTVELNRVELDHPVTHT